MDLTPYIDGVRNWVVNLKPEQLSAMATLLACLVAILMYFAVLSMRRIQKNRLRLDLFNKRYQVFLKVLDFCIACDEIGSNATAGCEDVDAKVHRLYSEAQPQIPFLFNKNSKIIDIVDQMHEKYIDLRESLRDMKKHADGQSSDEEKYAAACKQNEITLDWFERQSQKLFDVFAPYLDFSDIR